MKNNNYVGFGQVVEPDSQEMAKVIRNREQAKALYDEGLAPSQGQMVGGRYIKPALGQEIAKALKAYTGWKMGQDADIQEKRLTDAQNQDYNDTIDKYAQAIKGGDQDAAMGILAQSKSPALRQMYVQQLLGPSERAKYSTTPHFDRAGKAYLVSDSGAVKFLDGIQARDKMENWNGRVVNPYDINAGAVINDPNKPFMLTANGGAVPNRAYQNYEMAKSRAGASNISVNTAPKAFWGDLGKGASDSFLKEKDKAEAAKSMLSTIEEQERLLKSGIYSGPFANAKMFISKATGWNDEKVKNTEAFMAAAGRQVLDAVKQLGAGSGISNADRDFAARVVGGDIELSEPGLRRITAMARRASERTIENYNKKAAKVDASMQAQGLPFELMVEAPVSSGGQSGNMGQSDPDKSPVIDAEFEERLRKYR